MNWSQQGIESLVWIGQTYLLSLLGTLLVGAVLVRITVWGRQFWRLAGEYFRLRRDARPVLMAAGVLLLAIAGVRLNVLLSY